jgi:serine protease Do
VIAIGNPFGLGGTVTAGIVSALHRNIGAGLYDRYIQTDASINSGNSGGPMFDVNGNVIGINTALISPTGGNVGIGFAIPAEQVAPVVEQLRRGERVHRGYIGVGMQDVDEGVAAALGIDRNRGTLIRSVTPGGPAARAGIQQGDVVVSVAGRPVTPDADARLSDLAAGDRRARAGRGDPPGPAPHRHRRDRRASDRGGAGAAERRRGRRQQRQQRRRRQAERADPVGRPAFGAGQPRHLALEPLTPAMAQAAQYPRRQRPRPGRRHRRSEQRCRTEGRAGGRHHPVDQPAADGDAEAAAAIVDAARRAGRNTVLLQVKRGNNPPAYIGVDLVRAAAPARPAPAPAH